MVTLNGIGGDLTKTEFEIGGTRFAVAKLPAMAGFDLLEAIRHELGKSQALSLPTEVLKEGRQVDSSLPQDRAVAGPCVCAAGASEAIREGGLLQHAGSHSAAASWGRGVGLRRTGAHIDLRSAGAECSRKFYAVLRRPRLQVERRPPGFEPVRPLGIKPFFGALIDADLAEYLTLKNTLDLDDAMQLHEQLTARIENDHRAHEEAERKSKEKR